MRKAIYLKDSKEIYKGPKTNVSLAQSPLSVVDVTSNNYIEDVEVYWGRQP